MAQTLIFLGAFLLLFIVGLLYEIQRPSLNKVMKRYDSSYSGGFNNFQDRIRILKVYFHSKKLNKNEKRKLFFVIIMNLILYVSLIVMVILIIFDPNLLEDINHFFRNKE